MSIQIHTQKKIQPTSPTDLLTVSKIKIWLLLIKVFYFIIIILKSCLITLSYENSKIGQYEQVMNPKMKKFMITPSHF